MSEHQPVLMREVLEGLAVVGDGWYVDATYGRGGHCAAMLERLGPEGRLLAIDKDPEAVEHGQRSLGRDPRFTIRHGGFEQFAELVGPWLQSRRLSGTLFDLGVSSPQLDTPSRGFGFSSDGPIDMRMNPTEGQSAADWLARASKEDIARVIGEFGEQPGAHRIAAAIVRARDAGPLDSTARLAEIVAAAAPRSKRRLHPATRVFQAIRIRINAELEALSAALSQCVDLLGTGGRLAVISFHSLEDRIVKRFFANEARGDPAWAGLPNIPDAARPRLRRIGRLVRPTDEETAANPRARSARLRVAERLPGGAPARA